MDNVRNAMYVWTHLVQYAKIYKKYSQAINEDIMNYATCESLGRFSCMLRERFYMTCEIIFLNWKFHVTR